MTTFNVSISNELFFYGGSRANRWDEAVWDTDTWDVIEDLELQIFKTVSNSLNLNDAYYKNINKLISNTLNLDDSYLKSFDKIITNTLNLDEDLSELYLMNGDYFCLFSGEANIVNTPDNMYTTGFETLWDESFWDQDKWDATENEITWTVISASSSTWSET